MWLTPRSRAELADRHALVAPLGERVEGGIEQLVGADDVARARPWSPPTACVATDGDGLLADAQDMPRFLRRTTLVALAVLTGVTHSILTLTETAAAAPVTTAVPESVILYGDSLSWEARSTSPRPSGGPASPTSSTARSAGA